MFCYPDMEVTVTKCGKASQKPKVRTEGIQTEGIQTEGIQTEGIQTEGYRVGQRRERGPAV
jgi:hypothetical protein